MKKTEGRYHRQELLKEWNQELIRNSTVLVVGIGALGSVIALDLALMGIGKLTLIDNDTVELSNLNRQILFREEDIGKPKVEAAKEFLKELNPEVKVSSKNPSAFIIQTQDDPIGVENSLYYYAALQKAKVSSELHLFPSGGHGYGMEAGDSTVSIWPQLCETWLRQNEIISR